MRSVLQAMSLFRQRDPAIVLACNFVLGLAVSFVVPFMSIFGIKEAHMSPWVFGLFMTLTSLASVLVSTSLSRLSDTGWSRKTVILIGSCAGALGYGAYAVLRDVWLLGLVGCTLLAVASVAFSQIFAYARDLLTRIGVPANEVPLYINVFRVFVALAWTVGPAIAAWTMARYSFEGTFAVASALYVLLSIGIWLFLPDLRQTSEARLAAQQMSFRHSMQVPGLLAHFVGFILFFSCSTVGMMNLPLLILDTLGGTGKEVGFAYSIAPVFELPLMFYVGYLATRIDQSAIIRASLIVAVAYYALMAVVPNAWMVYPLQFLSALIVAVMGGLAITFFQNYLPSQAGTATNIYVNAQRFGSTLGYLGFGVLSETYGHRVVFAVCSGVALLSFATLYLGRTARRAVALS